MPLLKEALSATNCNPRDLKTENSLKTRRAVVDWTGGTIPGWVDKRTFITQASQDHIPLLGILNLKMKVTQDATAKHPE